MQEGGGHMATVTDTPMYICYHPMLAEIKAPICRWRLPFLRRTASNASSCGPRKVGTGSLKCRTLLLLGGTLAPTFVCRTLLLLAPNSLRLMPTHLTPGCTAAPLRTPQRLPSRLAGTAAPG